MTQAPSHAFAAEIASLALHSLWQGCLISLIVAVAATLIRSPAHRVRMIQTALLMFLFAQLATLLISVGPRDLPAHVEMARERVAALASAPRWDGSLRTMNVSSATLSRAGAMVVWLMPLVGGACLTVVVLVGVAGVVSLVRLRRALARCVAVPAAQHARYEELAVRLGVRKAVQYVSCSEVSVPATAGQRQPIVLIPPMGVLALSPREIDAAILHELAHVKRRDFAMNLFRATVRFAYLFNPFVWWLCASAHRAAESAADELAAIAYGDRPGYAQALLAVVSRRQSEPLLLGFGGGDLKTRVVSVLRGGGPTRSDRVATLAAIVVALVGLGASGRYVALGVAEQRTDAWVNSRSLGQAVVETLSEAGNEKPYVAALRTVIHESRTLGAPSARALDALVAESGVAPRADLLYRKACRDRLELKNTRDFGDLGTVAELRAVVDLLASNLRHPERVRAAVILAGILEVGDAGGTAQRLLQRPEILQSLALSALDSYRLQWAVGRHSECVARLSDEWARAQSAPERIAAFVVAERVDLMKCRRLEFAIAQHLRSGKLDFPCEVPEELAYLRAACRAD